MFLIASAFAQNQGSGGVAALKPGASNTSANIFVQANNSAAPFSLQPPINQVNGRRTSVTASGIVTVAGSSPTFNISLYAVRGAVPTTSPTATSSYTLIAHLGSAQALVTSASYPWYLNAILEGDSTSGLLQGNFTIGLDNTISASAALNAALTSVVFGYDPTTPTPSQAAPPYTLVIAVTFGVGNSSNQAVLTQFDLEA